MRWPEEAPYRGSLLDPCAGEAEAIATLAELWTPPRSQPSSPYGTPPRNPTWLACELEEERAQAALRRCWDEEARVYRGDAFTWSLKPGSSGATVLFLNPPYDTDPEFGRLEQRFLAHTTPMLRAGTGYLFFLVPHYALEASAEYLARQYVELRCWRLPAEHYAAYRQVLLVARKARFPLPTSEGAEAVRRWAQHPERLPELPERVADPFEVDLTVSHYLELELREPAPELAAEAFRPWQGGAAGLDGEASQLLAARTQTAVPPKPAHIALALSSGLFNGQRLEPDDPRRHPPILAKGMLRREWLTVSEKRNSEGRVTSTLEIERPSLALTLLRLDTYQFHRLPAGIAPAGGDDPAHWNAADLIAHYGRSLAKVLGQQFPPLHDPLDREKQIALPALARKPFRAQAHAVQASLKLLATGRNPFLVAEVGSGKCTMALTFAAALSPAHHRHTVAELARVGLPRVPCYRRTLVLCPPHLISTWEEEIAAVLPDAQVRVLRSIRDVEEEAARKLPTSLEPRFLLLSREAAKLGHGFRGLRGEEELLGPKRRGLPGRCPRCGKPILTDAATNAAKRLRCPHPQEPRPSLLRRLTQELAALILPACPGDSLVRSLAPRALLRRIEPTDAPRYANPKLLEAFLADVTYALEQLLAQKAARPDRTDTGPLATLLFLLEAVASPHRDGRQRILERLKAATSALPAELRTSLQSVQSTIQFLERSLYQSSPSSQPWARLLERLHEAAGEAAHEPRPCGEPLYQAVPEPRRFPLSKALARRLPGRFLLVIDEAHEMNHSESAQTKAAHRLAKLPGVATIVLTGSLMGGYASSLFPNFWTLSPALRQEFDRDEEDAFVQKYGYRKVAVQFAHERDAPEKGAVTDREIGRRQVVGEAPGVDSRFITRHLLPTAVMLHKGDLEADLPPLAELPVPLRAGDDPRDLDLLLEYKKLQDCLLSRIKKDRFAANLAGRLLGALMELPSYLDRCTDDLEPFVIAYPEHVGGALIAAARMFPASYRTPKERWMLARVKQALAENHRVLLFLRHTGTAPLPQRMLGLLRTLTPRVSFLDAQKVPTGRRQEWIRREIERGVEVLVLNPNTVRTGLNNLIAFNVGLWHELDYSTTTVRQANGRLHRIGQKKPVSIEFPFYARTAQQIAFDLIARKLSVSCLVDGLDLESALEAAGAGPEKAAATAAAMSLGQAVYEALVRGEEEPAEGTVSATAGEWKADRVPRKARTVRGGGLPLFD